MSANHTPEPWEVFPPETFIVTIAGNVESNRIICHIRFPQNSGMWRRIAGEDIANARRIVACVNACKGIETEKLERAAVVYLDGDSVITKGGIVRFPDEMDSLRTNRNELAALLREISGIATANESWSERVSKALGE